MRRLPGTLGWATASLLRHRCPQLLACRATARMIACINSLMTWNSRTWWRISPKTSVTGRGYRGEPSVVIPCKVRPRLSSSFLTFLQRTFRSRRNHRGHLRHTKAHKPGNDATNSNPGAISSSISSRLDICNKKPAFQCRKAGLFIHPQGDSNPCLTIPPKERKWRIISKLQEKTRQEKK